ncbi:MAG: hypothetical protein IT184_16415 [Acidobacteria bacterium]|nr:hypothetical protein [Acidobacteriota bacterium]
MKTVRLEALTAVGLFCVATLAAPRGAVAQDQSTATIKVYATVEGQPDGRASVAIRSLDDGRQPVRTLEAGAFLPAESRLLPVGRYRVEVSQDGYAAAAIETAVDPGEIVWLRATLRRSGQPSTIELLDRWHAGEAVVIGEDLLNGLPASGHVWSLIDALVPWTLVDGVDNGGSETGRRGLFGARDASWLWNAFVLDGIDITDPDRPSGPLLYADPKAMQAVSVTSGLAPAAVAVPGAQVTFVPRRPGATRHGSVEVSGTAPGMVFARENVVAPFLTKVHAYGDVNAQLSSPVSERVGAYVSGRITRSSFFDRGRDEMRPADAASLFAHVVARPTPRDEVRVIASAAQTKRPLEGGDAFLGRLVDERDTFAHGQARWDRVGRRGWVGSIAFGLDRGDFAPDLDAPVGGGVVDRAFDGPVPLPVAQRRTRRMDGAASVALPPYAIGASRHSWRIDGSLTSARATSDVLASPEVAELVAGLPARIWQFQTPAAEAVRRLTHVGWSIADDLRLGEHYAIDAGVRVDHWDGRAQGAPAGIRKAVVSPRLAVRSSFPSKGITAYGAIGRYHARLPLEWLGFGDPNQPWARLYRWTDANGNGRADPAERGPQLALAGWGGPLGSIDPDLRLPATNEYVLAGELRVGTATFRGTATIRHETSLVRAVNVGIPLADYTRTLIPDQTNERLMIPVFNRPPGREDLDRYVLTNPADDGLKSHMLEIFYEQRFTPRFRMRASALAWWAAGPTAAPGFHVNENDQGLVGEQFQDPNTLSNAGGRTFWDRAYVLKWSGTYLAPRDVWLAFTANYRDGQPFPGFLVLPDLVQGPEVLQNYLSGRTRFTFTMLVDARIEKRFTLGRGRRQAAVWLDVFNGPNMYEELEENPVVGPSFRASTVLQPPLTFRAGVRVGF